MDILPKRATADNVESNIDFVARLPQDVQKNYPGLVGRTDLLAVLKKMHPHPNQAACLKSQQTQRDF